MGKSRTLPSTISQPMPPTTPITAANTSAASTLPTTLPAATSPCVMICSMANTPTMHSTSVRADSSTSTVAGFSASFSALTMGITTADEVPPSVRPSNRAGSRSRPSVSMPITAMTMAVMEKQAKVSRPVVPADRPSTLRSSEVPLSNRITTSAMVASRVPTLPKSAGDTMPSTGPITMPISISTSTSGMLVRLNCSDRKCAKNTIRPMTSMVVDMAGLVLWIVADYIRAA